MIKDKNERQAAKRRDFQYHLGSYFLSSTNNTFYVWMGYFQSASFSRIFRSMSLNLVMRVTRGRATSKLLLVEGLRNFYVTEKCMYCDFFHFGVSVG